MVTQLSYRIYDFLQRIFTASLRFGYVCFIFGLVSTLAGCRQSEIMLVPGHVEGSYTYISASYSGILKSLYVTPGNIVKVGDPLFVLDLQPEKDQLKVAEERVTEAKAQKERFETDVKLKKTLLERKRKHCRETDREKDEFDTMSANHQEACANLKAAAANLSALEAELNKARWAARQKIVSASSAGLIFDIYYTLGEFVPNGRAVVSILNLSQVKIIFYCPEPLLSKIKLNQVITVLRDGSQNSIKGKIIFISPQAEYTPPVIYSNEERQKLVYRVEAQPLLQEALIELHTGQPVSVKLEK